MNKLFFLILYLFVLNCIFSEEPHHTTAYIDTPGKLDSLLTYSTYHTHHFWNKEGKTLPTYNHFDRQSYLLYSEYALNDRNSLSFNGGYAMVQETLNGNSCAFKDIELGWKYLLYKGNTSAFTIQCIEIIPVGKKKSSIRYGQPGVQISLLYSDIFYLKNFGWYDLNIGYRHYQGFPSSRLLANAAIGYQIRPCIYLISTTHLDYGLCNGNSHGNLNNVVLHPNYRLLNTQIECVIKMFSCAWLSIGAFKHVWGRNVGAGGGLFCGSWLIF